MNQKTTPQEPGEALAAAADICVAYITPPDKAADWESIRQGVLAIITRHFQPLRQRLLDAERERDEAKAQLADINEICENQDGGGTVARCIMKKVLRLYSDIRALREQATALRKELADKESLLRDAAFECAESRRLVSASSNDLEYLRATVATQAERIAGLEQWKKEQLTVASWWHEIDDFVRKHPDAPIGRSVAKIALEWLKERDDTKRTCAELVTDGNAITLAQSLQRMEATLIEIRAGYCVPVGKGPSLTKGDIFDLCNASLTPSTQPPTK